MVGAARFVVALVALLAAAYDLPAQTTWEIRSAHNWPIVGVVIDSLDGEMLAYDGGNRIHLDSITSLVSHRLRRGNPGGAVLGVLVGGTISIGIAFATIDVDGDRNDVATAFGVAAPVAGAIIGFMTKRDVSDAPIALSGLALEQRRAAVSGALRDAALEDASEAATGR